MKANKRDLILIRFFFGKYITDLQDDNFDLFFVKINVKHFKINPANMINDYLEYDFKGIEMVILIKESEYKYIVYFAVRQIVNGLFEKNIIYFFHHYFIFESKIASWLNWNKFVPNLMKCMANKKKIYFFFATTEQSSGQKLADLLVYKKIVNVKVRYFVSDNSSINAIKLSDNYLFN